MGLTLLDKTSVGFNSVGDLFSSCFSFDETIFASVISFMDNLEDIEVRFGESLDRRSSFGVESLEGGLLFVSVGLEIPRYFRTSEVAGDLLILSYSESNFSFSTNFACNNN